MSPAITLSIGNTLLESRFKDRPNRFVIRCYLPHGDLVLAHLHDPGRLKELLQPERKVWLRRAEGSHRKTKYSAVLVEDPRGQTLVSLDSTLPNRLIERALKSKALNELQDWTFLGKEFKKGSSRFDFLLEHGNGHKKVLEVKSVTLVRDGIGLFPDAVTSRGRRHVSELGEIAREEGWEAGVLFVLQRQDAHRIKADAKIDPDFARALLLAREAGVKVYGRSCTISLQEVILGPEIPVEM